MKYWLALIAFNFCAFGVQKSVELYSEQSYLSREEVLPNATRVQGFFHLYPWFQPYITLGGELNILNRNDVSHTDSGSYAYIGPGFKFLLSPFSLRFESRYREFYKDSPTSSSRDSMDLRSLLVYGQYFEKSLKILKTSQFLETYSETLFTTADSNNIINANFIRYGIKRQLHSLVSTDAYLEPFLTLDRIGHFYNNKAELRPSLRINHSITDWGLVHRLSGSYILTKYFSYADKEKNPYEHDADGWRLLYTLGINR